MTPSSKKKRDGISVFMTTEGKLLTSGFEGGRERDSVSILKSEINEIRLSISLFRSFPACGDLDIALQLILKETILFYFPLIICVKTESGTKFTNSARFFSVRIGEFRSIVRATDRPSERASPGFRSGLTFPAPRLLFLSLLSSHPLFKASLPPHPPFSVLYYPLFLLSFHPRVVQLSKLKITI